MSTNVGGVEFDIKIAGIKQEIKNIDALVTNFTQLNDKLVKGKKGKEANAVATKKLADALRMASVDAKRYVSSSKGAADNLRRLTSVQADLNRELKETQKLKRGTVTGSKSNKEARQLMALKVIQDKLAVSASKVAIAQSRQAMAATRAKMAVVQLAAAEQRLAQANIRTELTARRLSPPIDTTRRSVNRLSTAMRNNSHVGTGWIKRFTLIAGGFALAHAALRAFGASVRLLTGTFFRGAVIADDYAEGIATIAGMVAITHEGMGGFMERFQAVSKVMKKTMAESIRLAPTFRLSMEEITAGYRELAQFGIVVSSSMVNTTITTLSAIKEIAASTGSTTKQIRQEIQALMNGSAKVTDQFARTVKRTMPDVWKILKDPAVTTTEKWKAVTKQWSEFSHAAIMASQTLRGQFEKLKIGISLISQQALDGSGIYKVWVDKLILLNDKLFTEEGKLTEQGKKLAKSFDGIWNGLNNMLNLAVSAVGFLRDLAVSFTALNPLIKDGAISLLKMSGWMFLLTSTLSIATGAMRGFLAVTGIAAAWRIVKWAGAVALPALVRGFGALLIPVTAILRPLIMFAAVLGAGVAAGKIFSSVFGGIYELFTQLSNPNLWSSTWDVWKAGWDRLIAIFASDEEKAKAKAGWHAALANLVVIDWKQINEAGMKEGAKYDAGLSIIKDKLVSEVTELKDTVVGLFDFDLFSGDEGQLATTKTALDGLMDKWDKLINGFREGLKPKEKDDTLIIDPDAMDSNIEAVSKYVNLIDSLGNNLKSTWDDLFSGKLSGFQSLWASIMDNVVKTFQDAMSDMTSIYVNTFLKKLAENSLKDFGGSDMTLGTIAKGVLGMFSTSTQGSSQYGGLGQATRGLATGGLITEPIAGIGMNTGRNYKFGEQGTERVLSASQTRQSQAGGDVAVNIVNNTSGKVTKSQSQPRFDGRKMVIDVILADYASGGATYKAFSGGR